MFHVILLNSSGEQMYSQIWRTCENISPACMQSYLVGQVVDREVVNRRLLWSHWKCNPRADEIIGGQVRHRIA